MKNVQTILGSGGVIGSHLAHDLLPYTDKVRLVRRSHVLTDSRFDHRMADLTNPEELSSAIEGSDIVYLTAGIKYSLPAWQEQWPLIMKNTLQACRNLNAKLVFFDNVYAYGHVNGWMTESTPYHPSSEKGKVRQAIAEMLMDAVDEGKIQAIIARSADFYGPNATTSFTKMLIFDKLTKGKKPQWMVNDEVKHSFTYTPDAAKAVALLGNTPAAFDQIWHLPTDHNALSGREFIEMAAETFDSDNNDFTVLKKWMLALVGAFTPLVKENMEMLYQFEFDYLFDSTKFEKTFGIKATTYKQGIIEIFNQVKKKTQTT
jgi:nucleoside-diphosphate-sugar epimerase